MEKITLSFNIDGNDFARAGEASAAVKNTLNERGVGSAFVRKAAIAMYEAEINSFIHAGGGTAYVEITDGEVYIKISDNGPGIPDIGQAMREGFSTATERVRSLGFGAGMGLPNMKNYADRIEVLSRVGEGTTVEMWISLS